MRDLEIQKQQIEKDITNIDFEISQGKQQTLDAQVMHESLTRFRQIYEKATPIELMELLPRFVERIIWTPTEIQIALFDHEVEKGAVPNDVNHPEGGALEFVDWLRGQGSNLQPSG